jgi:protein TonB
VTGSGGSKLKNVFDLAALDQKPEARVRIKPIYPFEMRRSGLKGEVVVGFIVDSNGDPREPYIVRSSNAGFEEAAIQAVMKWKFKPGKKGGASVNTRVQQPLTFNLDAS